MHKGQDLQVAVSFRRPVGLHRMHFLVRLLLFNDLRRWCIRLVLAFFVEFTHGSSGDLGQLQRLHQRFLFSLLDILSRLVIFLFQSFSNLTILLHFGLMLFVSH